MPSASTLEPRGRCVIVADWPLMESVPSGNSLCQRPHLWRCYQGQEGAGMEVNVFLPVPAGLVAFSPHCVASLSLLFHLQDILVLLELK